MANHTDEPGTPQDTGRRRRAPTIEGSATEIAVDPVAEEAAAAPVTPPQAADLADQIAVPPNDDAPPAAAEAAGPVPDEPAVGGSDGGDGPPAEPPPFTPIPAAADAGSPVWRGMAAGGLAGAVVVALAGAGAYYLLPRDPPPELVARIVRVETSVAGLAARPASAVAPEKIDDMAARIGQIEAKIADVPSGTAGIPEDRLAAIAATAKSLSERTEALAKRTEDTRAGLGALDQRLAAAQKTLADLDPARFATLEARVAAAEAAVKETRAALAAVTEPPALKTVRVAVVAQALEAAVMRGSGYAPELAAVRAFKPDEPALAALAPFADAGLPGAAALAGELASLAPKIDAAAAPKSADQSMLAKFTANAEKLVRVRPAGDAAGDDAGAVLTRMEAKAKRGDLPGAVAEAQKLPAEARALAEPWVKRVETREAARAAAHKLAAATLAAVSTDKGPAK